MFMALVECNRTGTLALVVINLILQGAISSGSEVNQTDIAPNFAGTLYGISNAIGSVASLLAPLTAGKLTNNQVKRLCIVFGYTFCLNMTSGSNLSFGLSCIILNHNHS